MYKQKYLVIIKIHPKDDLYLIKNQMSETLAQLDAVKTHYEDVKKIIQTVMIKGEDYSEIVKGAKPSLLKGGAEKMRMLFGGEPKLERTDEVVDLDKDYYSVSYKCMILRDGKILGECEANVNTFEEKYFSRTEYIDKNDYMKLSDELRKEYKDSKYGYQRKVELKNKISQRNTIMKMAQKRAFVGAVLMAYGVSQFYTQDLEDYATPDATPEVAKATTVEVTEVVTNPITSATLENLNGIVEAYKLIHNKTDKEMLKAVKTYYNKKGYSELTEDEGLSLIAKLNEKMDTNLPKNDPEVIPAVESGAQSEEKTS